jgi:hypothetical protein
MIKGSFVNSILVTMKTMLLDKLKYYCDQSVATNFPLQRFLRLAEN